MSRPPLSHPQLEQTLKEQDKPPRMAVLGEAAALDSGLASWTSLTDAIETLTQLAQGKPTPREFYGQVAQQCQQVLAPDAVAIWSLHGSAFKRLATIGEALASDSERETLLLKAAQHRETAALPLNGGTHVIGPVLAETSADEAGYSASDLSALIELSFAGTTNQSNSAQPNIDRAEAFLSAVCEVAHQYELVRRLNWLKDHQRWHEQSQAFSQAVHSSLDLKATAYAIVNEGRRIIPCDRVSLLQVKRGRCELLATSGVDRIEKQTPVARQMREIANLCYQTGEPLYLASSQADLTPAADPFQADTTEPGEDLLRSYADSSQATQVAVMPMTRSQAPDELGAEATTPEVVGVLITEQFLAGGNDLAKDRVAEMASLAASALANAQQHHALPLRATLTRLQKLIEPRGAIAAAVALATLLTLLLVPADYEVQARGELQPVAKQNLFAPSDAVVQAILVGHGDSVSEGTPLLELHSPELELELQKTEGQLAATQRQLAAVQATRTSLGGRSRQERRTGDRSNGETVEALKLAAEEQVLTHQLNSHQDERLLLQAEIDRLVIRSPRPGTILSWQIEESLLGRPVQRGQQLLTVANTAGDWQVELQVDDNRLGPLLESQNRESETADSKGVAVRFRPATAETDYFHGTVQRVATLVDTTDGTAGQVNRTAQVIVMPDEPLQEMLSASELRPGLSVRAKIVCGRRSLAYVWFHDAWLTITTWWEFL